MGRECLLSFFSLFVHWFLTEKEICLSRRRSSISNFSSNKIAKFGAKISFPPHADHANAKLFQNRFSIYYKRPELVEYK